MLTVKNIEPSLHETVFEAATVSTERAGLKSDNVSRVYFTRSNGTVGSLETGTVYVMNGAGQTVATYHLGGWPEPAPEAA